MDRSPQQANRVKLRLTERPARWTRGTSRDAAFAPSRCLTRYIATVFPRAREVREEVQSGNGASQISEPRHNHAITARARAGGPWNPSWPAVTHRMLSDH